jgi:ornithine cyclodeaminase
MLMIDQDGVKRLTEFGPLAEAIREMFRKDCVMPVRHHHTIKVPGEADATALLMPAWTEGEYLGIKLVNVFPGNATRGMPAVSGVFVLFDGMTGQAVALIDGGELTARRTAAASALAADYLARKDASHLLVVATGRLAPNQIGAYRAVRDIERVTVWGRNPENAAKIVAGFEGSGLETAVATDLEAAVGEADIVSCATLAMDPIIKGEWLRPGVHLDLIGGFTPKMREADDECIRRATVFCDTRDGALAEAGDLVQPLENGVLKAEDIAADLYDLCRGRHPGRTSDEQITMHKATGAALEDLAAALLAYEQAAK